VRDGENVTNLLRLLYVLVALPGRLLVRWLDRKRHENGLLPMGGFLRGSVHGFVWLIALMIFSMATVTPTRTDEIERVQPERSRVTELARRYTPPPTTTVLVPTPTPTSEPEPVYVPLPDDDDDDWDKPRICHRKWWC
jgi:hypothetical protein